MKKAAITAIVLSLCFLSSAEATVPAFPNAEGVGKWSLGGRGGTVYEVTNLNDSGPGSLRAAVEASGPRTVIFRVSGNIELQSNLIVTNSYITIAGQTAPGGGICTWRYPLVVEANDVVIRYIRCRTSDEAFLDPGFIPEGMDSLSVNSGYNIIIDHCSGSWSVDEVLSSSVQPGGSQLDNITVQWCIISEGLNCSVHNSPDCHGYGTLAKGGYGAEYSYHHNLYAHNKSRNPYPGNYNDISVDPAGLTFDFRNNVIYNWDGTYAGYVTQSGANSVTKINFVGNYYKAGLDSDGNLAFYDAVYAARGYFSANWMNTSYPADPWSLVTYKSGWTSQQKADFKLTSPTPVSESIPQEDALSAYQRVLFEGGASLPARDAVDRRIINDVKNGTGNIIDDETEVGGWPVLVSTTPPADSDHDGMPDEWEIDRGLDPNNVSDGNGDLDSDEYTNLEEYLNHLVDRGSIDPDLDNDEKMDMLDFALFANHWLETGCNESNDWCEGTDFDGNYQTDGNDLAVLADDWLEGVVIGAVYYVATDGNDLNPGTSSLPWKTIGKAAATIVAGDSVLVRPGTYYEQVLPANSGIKKAPIKFIADPDGEVVINAGGLGNGFYADSKCWIVIDGFKVTGAVNEGVRFTRANDNTVRNCEIYGCGREGITSYDGKRNKIENCLVYSNLGSGIKTIVYSTGVEVTGCTVYGNSYSGLSLSTTGDGAIKDCIITNNATGISSSSAHIVTYCDVWGNTTDYSGGVSGGTGSISSDPLFVTPGTDFHLLPASPCIGTGSEGNDMGYSYPP